MLHGPLGVLARSRRVSLLRHLQACLPHAGDLVTLQSISQHWPIEPIDFSQPLSAWPIEPIEFQPIDPIGTNVAQKLTRDINTETVTKTVPMKAVNKPICAFCIAFRCEHFCDNDFLLSLSQLIGRPEASNRVCHSRSADRLHQPMEPIGNSSRLADWSQPIGAD